MRGASLARAYATEVVGPLLESALPGVPIALARLGSGSDVLGFDDETSRDHDWGLRLTVIVGEHRVADAELALHEGLPESWRGLPTRFATTWDPVARVRAEVSTLRNLAFSRTGLDPDREPTTAEWLSLTGQAALELVGGPVFRDDDGALTAARGRLAGYPDDVRAFAVASGWHRVGQELPFVGRTASRGDDLGSRVITARLVRTLMHLGFLLERRWAPYSKWLGTAFAALPGSGAASGPLRRASAAANGADRERALERAIGILGRRQGASGLPTVDELTEQFWDRPFLALAGLPEATREAIADPGIRQLPLLGTPEQWCDTVDVLVDAERRHAATRALYPML